MTSLGTRASYRVEASIDEHTAELLDPRPGDSFLEAGFGRGDLLEEAAIPFASSSFTKIRTVNVIYFQRDGCESSSALAR